MLFIKDKSQDIIIRGETIKYEKSLEKIFSENITKIDINKNYKIEGSNIYFLRLKKDLVK